jgi:acyl-CoA reductase-like NAD-dependent aldehyde dehydrogenase
MTLPSSSPSTIRSADPYGVCAGIVPFNWPPNHTGGKTALALAAGNTIVLKPAEQAPLTLIRIVEIISEILPANVVQVVPGLGPAVPQALVAHPLVKMVSFTGSSPVGTQVAAAAGKAIKPVVLELGGKNAFVVFDDADLESAVRVAIAGAFFNKGEACTATSRFLIQREVYDSFCVRLSAAISQLKLGNGMDASTHVGPLVSKEQQDRVLSYLTMAQNDSQVRICAQASPPTDPGCKNGYFVPPTLIADVPRSHVLARKEIFGPIATATPFDNEAEAISIVNESEYGLTSAVFSRDHEKCLRFARKVDVGLVFINSYTRSVLGTPFGGTKHSGYGREHSIESLRSWARAKVVKEPSGMAPLPEWRAIRDIFIE